MTRAERRERLADIGRFVFNRYRQAAQRAVSAAVREGRLASVRTLLCADCGTTAGQYDHRSYDHPLVVAPVCHACNMKRGMASLTIERVWRDLSPYWGSALDIEEYCRTLGIPLENEIGRTK